MAAAVSVMLTSVTNRVPNRFVSRSAIRLEIIVEPEITIVAMPIACSGT